MDTSVLHLQIYSPEHILFEGEINMITLPGSLGSFSVFPFHAPLISSLKKGVITFEINIQDGEKKSEVRLLPIERGFMEIKNNKVVVCVEEKEK